MLKKGGLATFFYTLTLPLRKLHLKTDLTLITDLGLIKPVPR